MFIIFLIVILLKIFHYPIDLVLFQHQHKVIDSGDLISLILILIFIFLCEVVVYRSISIIVGLEVNPSLILHSAAELFKLHFSFNFEFLSEKEWILYIFFLKQ